ncbi:phosphotransferase [Frigidibacter sp. RF13]|uniref:phosphotransferase enzyme family protein n=1 Tax=Frigidibacter sp. RF13 TaxID=2997340 RepID=UPI00226E9BE5|nr:phosphotransferase [Frigidibacter sp. RF13]MCY1128059.1 phosphotransferase [Frigidibacter sp. RF13]
MTDEGTAAIAAKAARLWGAVAAPELIVARENIVYRMELSQGRRAALRLHRVGYQSRAAIEAELLWTGALAAHGFPTPGPVPLPGGEVSVDVGGRTVSATEWIQGEPVGRAALPLCGSRTVQADLHRDIGRLIARLHNMTDCLDLLPVLPRPRWDAEGLLGAAPLWGPFWRHPGLDSEASALLHGVRASLYERLARGDGYAADFGLIHADVLRENLLLADGNLSLIDFDDSGYGYRIYDLGTALVQSLEEAALPDLSCALLDGYNGERVQPIPFSEEDLRIGVLLRALASCGWIQSRAAPDDPRQGLYVTRAVRLATLVERALPGWA